MLTKFKATLLLLTCAVLTAVVSILISQQVFELRADTSFLLNQLPYSEGWWFKYSNALSNASHLWRINPLIATLTSCSARIIFYTLFFACGIYSLLIRKNPASHSYWPAIWALITPLLVFALCGLDLVALSVLAWSPWLLLLLILPNSTFSKDLIIGLCVALIASYDLNQFGLLLVLILSLSTPATTGRNARLLGLICVFSFVSLTLPSVAKQEFSAYAHVVSDYGTTEGLFPYFGASPALPFLDRESLRYSSNLLGIGVLILVALSMIKVTYSPQIRTVLLLLSFSVFADGSFFSAQFSQLMPLSSISRILPGVSFIALAPIISCLVLMLVIVTQTTNPKYILSLILCFTSFCAIPVLAQRVSHSKIYTTWSNLTADQRLKILPILYTPSYRIISEYGIQRLLDPTMLDRLHFSALRNFHPLLTANNKADVALSIDRDLATRWHSTSNTNKENWLNIQFASPITIIALRLDTGSFSTDFARDLEVEVTRSCENQNDRELVYRTTNWQGPLRFTQNGTPYFGPQKQVDILFEKEMKVCAIKIIQHKHNNDYDWSVAEIALAHR